MEQASLFQDRVRERDLDNFLVEELHASLAFRQWFLARLDDRFVESAAGKVTLEKSPQRLQDNRQTDVRMAWVDDEGALVSCVLIESKVTADFQPGQAASYAAEIAQYRQSLGERRACALLVAPAAKLPALAHDGAFDASIAVEEIVAFLVQRRAEGLSSELDARLEARIALLDAICGKRSGAGWTPITVPEKRAFAIEYEALAKQIAPELTVRASSDGGKALTRFFDGLKLPASFPTVRLKHEFGSGAAWKYANLQFDGLGGKLDALVASKLLDGTAFSAEVSGKSLFIRAQTPGLDPKGSFDAQCEKVRTGLEAVRNLAAWLAQNATQVERALAGKPVETTPNA